MPPVTHRPLPGRCHRPPSRRRTAGGQAGDTRSSPTRGGHARRRRPALGRRSPRAVAGRVRRGRTGLTAGGRLFAAYDPAADRWLRLQLEPVGPTAGAGARWIGEPPGMTVAILGPDGAGKSTLAADLGATFILPTERSSTPACTRPGGGGSVYRRWGRSAHARPAVAVSARCGLAARREAGWCCSIATPTTPGCRCRAARAAGAPAGAPAPGRCAPGARPRGRPRRPGRGALARRASIRSRPSRPSGGASRAARRRCSTAPCSTRPPTLDAVRRTLTAHRLGPLRRPTGGSTRVPDVTHESSCPMAIPVHAGRPRRGTVGVVEAGPGLGDGPAGRGDGARRVVWGRAPDTPRRRAGSRPLGRGPRAGAPAAPPSADRPGFGS